MGKGRATEDKDFPIYYCSYCQETFKKPKAKYRHMVKAHAKQYEEDLSKEKQVVKGQVKTKPETGWERQKRAYGK